MTSAAPADKSKAASGSVLAPLKHGVFRNVWFASMASNFGGMIQSVGAAWLMASIAKEADTVALIQASVTAPIMLFSLMAGALADTLDRRKMMLTAQSFMLVASIGLAACTFTGLITPWLLLLFTFLIGCGTAFNGPAWQASVGEMVPRSDLPSAVALNSMGFNIARSLGPAVGGAIVAAIGAAFAFVLNAVSYIGLIFVLARWKPNRPPQMLPAEPLGAAMGSGIRYVSMSPHLRVVMLRAAIFGFAAVAVQALMPVIARDQISGGPLGYGLLLGAFGVGAVGGAFVSAKLRRRLSTEGVVRCACLSFAFAALVAAFSAYLALTMAGFLFAGAGWVLALSTFNTSVQMSAPRWVVGRALSLYQMSAFGGMALGSWCWGLTAEHIGIAAALCGGGALLLLNLALGFRLPLPQFSGLDLDPLNRFKEPEIAMHIEPRSGPIVVTIEYRIREQDVVAFLRAMAERRRVRKRDGARHWTLLRDLNDPEVWIERYHAATWLDYVRHNSRTTKADAAISEQLRLLHKGPETPKVHRMIERQTDAITTAEPRTQTDHHHEPLTDPNRAS
ncbi:MAG: MFS transporter [Alphaproteobacteria bacterium]